MHPGDQLDGYTVLRLIGRGGYGEVWLCRSDAVGDFRALKFIATGSPELLEREFGALGNYRRAASRLRSPHLMAVEHVGRTAAGLYYVMPLADGIGGTGPEDPDWHPLTLAALVAERANAATWFTCREIAGLMRPMLEALQILADAGLVHRDVKPDNILFFGGQPCLADIGLLDEDSATLTRLGTPGYLTPSWYLGGHPDMYGTAATLYTLLTGNLPDRMGRSAFNGPPQGDASLPADERNWRKHLHAVIRRATDERPAERYRDFLAMANALANEPAKRSGGSRILAVASVVALAVAAGVTVSVIHGKRRQQAPATPAVVAGDAKQASNELPELTMEQKADYQALAAMIQGYIGDGEYANALASVETLLDEYPQARTQPAYSIARAMALIGLERVEEAKEELRKEIHLSPKISPMATRKDLWEQLGELGEAEQDLTRILAKFGPNSFVLFLRADVRAKRGDFAGVYADRQAALAIRPDDPEQKQLVETMWAPLETKFPGYSDHLQSIGAEPSPAVSENAPSNDVSSRVDPPNLDWIWNLDGEPWVFEEFLGANGDTLSEKARLARVEVSNRVQAAFVDGDNQRALQFLDEILYSMPVYGNQPGISLLRAVLLKRLSRLPEMEAELRKPCHRGETDLKDLGARVFLWDLLERWRDAEEFLTRIIDQPPEGPDRIPARTLDLLKFRATMRARLGDYAGVLADKKAAFAACGIADPSRESPAPRQPTQPDDQPGLDESVSIDEYVDTRIRIDIAEAWRVIEEHFPDYAAYLKAHPDE